MKALLVFLALFYSPAVALGGEAFDHEPETARLTTVMSRADAVGLAEKTDAALDAAVETAATELAAKGLGMEAARIKGQWARNFKGTLPASMRLGDIGDHAALSEWLKSLYWENQGVASGSLVNLLGENLCKLLHLNDIFYINAGIPVVFHMKSITELIDAPEYEVHFVPFSGAVAYWTVWGVCTAATWGADISLICGPAGTLARRVTVNRIAPRYSDRFWEKFYGG